MEDNDEALTFTADYVSDVGSVPDDSVSEGSDRRFATFSLSMSDFGDFDDRRSEVALDDDWTDDVVDVSEPERTPFWRREKRLSRILGISADERCEKQLMQGGPVTDDLLQDITVSERFAHRTRRIDIGRSESAEFDYLESGPMRRCTSLKSSKTPPGTPRHKKAVRFADALGLDLASIKQILNQEDPPIVPDSATKGLNVDERYFAMWPFAYGGKGFPEPAAPVQRVRHLCACFAQPGYSPDFARRIEERRVSLEHCTVDDVLLMVSGTIRVANISFEKHVAVRYTIDGWMTYTDELANYAQGGAASDQFKFKIHLPDYFDFSSRMEFSVMYVVAGQTFWDSNFGANYRIECHVEESPLAVRRVDAAARLAKDTSRHPFY